MPSLQLSMMHVTVLARERPRHAAAAAQHDARHCFGTGAPPVMPPLQLSMMHVTVSAQQHDARHCASTGAPPSCHRCSSA